MIGAQSATDHDMKYNPLNKINYIYNKEGKIAEC